MSDELSLKLYYYNIGKLTWEILPGAMVDIDNNKVAGDISQLSMYMIAEPNADEQITPPVPDDTAPGGGESSSDDGGGSGGCFIATAAFGTKMAKDVRILCKFRDGYLLTNTPGRNLVKLYYQYSPPIADYIAQHNKLRAMVRDGLKPVVLFARVTCAASN